MNTVKEMRRGIMIALLATLAVSADAHKRPVRRHVIHPATVVVKPVVVARASNSFDSQDRLAMALAYIDSHKSITAKRYAKLTGLPKRAAEAELDAFARSGKAHIAVARNGKKKAYVRASWGS